MSKQKQCFYDTLGVGKSASEAELKKAWRKLAVKWHPDKHVNDTPAQQEAAETKFKDILNAYQELSNKKKREIYGQSIPPPPSLPPSTPWNMVTDSSDGEGEGEAA